MPAFTTLLGSFEQRHPSIKVKHLNFPAADLQSNLKTLMAGGNPPDLLDLSTGMFEAFASYGVLLPLDAFYHRDRIDLLQYVPGIVPGISYHGQIFGAPLSLSDNGLIFYNKALFHQAGVPFPVQGATSWTWESFREAALRLTRPERRQWGFAVQNHVDGWGNFVVGNGGQILSADRKQCLMTDPKTVQALDFYYGLQFRDRVSPPPNAFPSAHNSAGALFEAGAIAMAPLGPGWRQAVAKYPFRVGIVSTPFSPRTMQTASMRYVDSFCATAPARHAEEAWQLLKWLGSSDWHVRWLRAYGPSSVDPVRAVDETTTWLRAGSTDGHAVLADLKYGVAPPTNFALGAQVSAIWDRELARVQLGEESAATAAHTITAQAHALLVQRERP
jgi:multiple sugar transport system substrate-binding protein